MLSKKQSRIIAAILLVFAVLFFLYAITHPTASFPWSNAVTYCIYAVYLLAVVILLVAPWRTGTRK